MYRRGCSSPHARQAVQAALRPSRFVDLLPFWTRYNLSRRSSSHLCSRSSTHHASGRCYIRAGTLCERDFERRVLEAQRLGVERCVSLPISVYCETDRSIMTKGGWD